MATVWHGGAPFGTAAFIANGGMGVSTPIIKIKKNSREFFLN